MKKYSSIKTGRNRYKLVVVESSSFKWVNITKRIELDVKSLVSGRQSVQSSALLKIFKVHFKSKQNIQLSFWFVFLRL